MSFLQLELDLYAYWRSSLELVLSHKIPLPDTPVLLDCLIQHIYLEVSSIKVVRFASK